MFLFINYVYIFCRFYSVRIWNKFKHWELVQNNRPQMLVFNEDPYHWKFGCPQHNIIVSDKRISVNFEGWLEVIHFIMILNKWLASSVHAFNDNSFSGLVIHPTTNICSTTNLHYHHRSFKLKHGWTLEYVFQRKNKIILIHRINSCRGILGMNMRQQKHGAWTWKQCEKHGGSFIDWWYVQKWNTFIQSPSLC